MSNYKRQELQDDIFRMYSAAVDSEKKSRNAPVEISILREALCGNKLYEEIDFETELSYLVESGYFNIYGSINIIPTAEGMNKIWGSTNNPPQGTKPRENEEIFKVQPELYGIGINLKLIWKRIKNRLRI